ncbi:pectate lyase-domain-containing protein [Pyrenochaeta sp. MPI-SDFR-AT-0127]|nr:pectate lyase-domain-containing protein [Pyrenochaeta sp. MPI-SDFR-AT-0127]
MRYTIAFLAPFVASTLAAPTATAFPAAASSTSLPRPIIVSKTFDGKMVRYGRTRTDAAMFIAEDGAVIKNVIINRNVADAIYCRGSCTLENVWWEDICETAAVFQQVAGKTSNIIGGGAKSAVDNIFQFNGLGTVSIKDFYAQDYGKVIRSCGSCKNNGSPRHIQIDGVLAKNGGALCGINTNFSDTCKITNSCQNNGKSCDRYKGVTGSSAGEAVKLGSGPDGTSCTATGLTSSC